MRRIITSSGPSRQPIWNGHSEERRHLVCHGVGWLFSDRRFTDEPRFSLLAMVGMLATSVKRGGERQSERRYYLSSAKLEAKAFAHTERSHWGI
jgi:hypothetical protein